MNTVHTFNIINAIQSLVSEAREKETMEKLITQSRNVTPTTCLFTVYTGEDILFTLDFKEGKINVFYKLAGKWRDFSTTSTSTILRFAMAMLVLDQEMWD